VFNFWFYEYQTIESKRGGKGYLSCEQFPKNNGKAKDIGFVIIWSMFNNLPYVKGITSLIIINTVSSRRQKILIFLVVLNNQGCYIFVLNENFTKWETKLLLSIGKAHRQPKAVLKPCQH